MQRHLRYMAVHEAGVARMPPAEAVCRAVRRGESGESEVSAGDWLIGGKKCSSVQRQHSCFTSGNSESMIWSMLRWSKSGIASSFICVRQRLATLSSTLST